jgi:Sigma-70, region 4
MATLETLPADQRAVLQLVLQRGRSYDQIASMLSIDRAAVRERALAGLDALGPPSDTPAPQRALLTDYLLGQLPERVAALTRDRLASFPADRAWARVVAAEISPLASSPLPEIPVGRAGPAHEAEPEPDPAQADEYQRYEDAPAPAAAPVIPPDYGLDAPRQTIDKPSSRRGGAILLGAVGVVIVAIVVIIIATSGGSSKHNQVASTPTSPSTSTPASSTTASTPTTTTTGTGKAKLVTQVNLVSPNSSDKSAAGVAQVIADGSKTAVVIIAQGLPANSSSNAYAVWLYKSASQSVLLGFVNARVTSNGRLSTEGVLPANASQYSQLLLTLETQAKPTSPGQTVLEGSPPAGKPF